MATKLYKTRICALLAIVGLSSVLTQSTVTAQTIPNANWDMVNSPGSVLHGRTVAVADELLRSLNFEQYNQVTNLAQLHNITSLNLHRKFNRKVNGEWVLPASPRVSDLAGLTNLVTLDISVNFFTNLTAGIFDDLVDLQTLNFGGNIFSAPLPSGIFDSLVNLQTLYLDSSFLYPLPSGIFDNLVNLQELRLYNNQLLTTLPSGIFDNLVNLQRLGISSGGAWREGIWVSYLPAGIFDKLVGVQGIHDYFLTYDGVISLEASEAEVDEGERAVINIKRNLIATSAFSGVSSVDYATSDGTARAGVDYTATSGTLTFSETNVVRAAQAISISLLEDDVTHESPKTFTLTLSNPTNAVFLDGVSELTATVTITDDEEPPTVSFSNVPLNAHILEVTEGNEGATNAEFQVQLGQASGRTTSVLYTTQDGTAIAGEDYIAASGTLTFLAGTTNQIISIPILGDELDEPNESFSVILRDPTNSILQPRTVRVEIIDDDEPAPPVNVHVSLPGGVTLPSLMFQTTSLSLSESGSDTYQVRATSSQNRNMIVNIQTAHPGVTVTPSKLMFNQNNWQTYQTVTVTASAEAADTNEQAYIMHSIPASNGFIANNNAGVVSITLAHTILEEPNGKDIVEPEEPVDPEPPTNSEPVDYDQDDNGLIDVSNLTQLNAIRWDLNGDGQPDKEEFAKAYNQAFPSAIANMGVPAEVPIRGYELTTNLHFDSHKNNQADEEDPFWNPGNGWQSIGVFANPFQAVLEGNNHGIVNLFQDQSDAALFYEKPSGLFGAIGNRGQVVNVGLEGVHIQGVNFVGALAGLNQGLIRNCSVRGRVAGANSVGGLVGHNFGHIADSHVRAAVLGNIGVGGLVGWNAGGLIEGSTAPGQEGQESLGLVGFGTPAR